MLFIHRAKYRRSQDKVQSPPKWLSGAEGKACVGFISGSCCHCQFSCLGIVFCSSTLHAHWEEVPRRGKVVVIGSYKVQDLYHSTGSSISQDGDPYGSGHLLLLLLLEAALAPTQAGKGEWRSRGKEPLLEGEWQHRESRFITSSLCLHHTLRPFSEPQALLIYRPAHPPRVL